MIWRSSGTEMESYGRYMERPCTIIWRYSYGNVPQDLPNALDTRRTSPAFLEIIQKEWFNITSQTGKKMQQTSTLRIDDSAVGKDVEAKCSKCGESWHVIVAVDDGKIVEVECKSCGGRHKYRPLHRDRLTVKKNTSTSIALGTSDPDAKIKSTGTKTPRAAGEKRSSKAAAEPAILTPRVEHNGNDTKEYNIKRTDYVLGDRILHKKFGEGIVDEILESQGKMYVTFLTVRTLLVYGK
jgi:hypothetical protein